MIHLYPPSLLSSTSLSLGKRLAPKNCLLYLSFEDALDALLEAQIPRGAAVLVPAYYCWSVVHHLEAKGCRVVSYPVGPDLQAVRSAFEEALENEKPDLVILFHPLGIETILKQNPTWTSKLSPTAVVLEDYAHRLFNESDSHPYERWIAINSFRKLSAAEGAWAWGSEAVLKSLKPPHAALSLYRAKVAALFSLWRAALGAAGLAESEHLFALSERLYTAHEQLIGASRVPQAGSSCYAFWFSRLNVSRLREHRRKIAQIYFTAFTSAPLSGIDLPEISPETWGELKFFPLKVEIQLSARILAQLAKRRCYLDILYEESPHCIGFVYLMLPLYPSLDEAEARQIGNWIHVEAN